MIAMANFHMAQRLSTMIRRGQYKPQYKEKGKTQNAIAIKILVQNKFTKDEKYDAKTERVISNFEWHEYDILD